MDKLEIVFNAIRDLFPVELPDGSYIKLKSIYAKNKDKYSPYDYPGHKKAIEQNKTYGYPLYIDYQVVDKQGRVLREGSKKIGTWPVKTARNTFIVDGVEYQITKQFLLKPGIYTQENTVGEVESFVNVPGLGMKITYDPKKMIFLVKIRQAKIPLYSLLKILGASDSEIERTWGREIYEVNRKQDVGVDARRLFRVFYSYEQMPSDIGEVVDKVREYLSGRELDPETTRITLGTSYDNLTADAILKASKKILNILKGKDEPDRKDDVAFKRVRQVYHLVSDRIIKNAKQILRKIKSEKDLSRFGQVIQQTFTMSNLSEIPMEINPVTILNAGAKTTIMGEDGISSVHSIPDEARNLSPAQVGFIDPVNTPESIKSGVTVNLSVDTTDDPSSGDLKRSFIDPKTKQKKLLRAIDVYDKYVAFPDQWDNGKWKDPKHVVAVYKGKQVVVPANKIDYVLPSVHSAFTLATNMIPFANHNHGNRLAMGSRQIPQAVALEEPDEPLVQVKAPEALKNVGSTMEEIVAKVSNVIYAPEDGIIQDVTDEYVTMKGKSGKKYKFPLYKDFPLANKSLLSNIVRVKKGDKVKKGDLIADNNFSKNGKLALGANLKVAYMPWKSYTFEDGIVVSESAAKKLTSVHMIQFVLDDKAFVIDKAKFKAMYPTKYTQEQLNKIGDNGLAKPGVKLEYGDPVILALKEEIGTPEDIVLNKLHKSLVKPYKDKSITWSYTTPGEVTSSVKAGGEAKVFVKTKLPAVVGDKLALRHGMKGVITAIVPDEEMPVSKADGKPAEVLISPESVITRMSIGQMLEAGASKVAKKTGKPYIVENFSKEKYLDKIQKDLKKVGYDPDGTEEFIDPKTGKSYGKVFSGYPQVQKLFKITKGNFSARQTGAYDMDLRPIKGGEEGAKAIDFPQLFYSLVSHNARATLRDAATYKGEFNPEAWEALLSGAPLPAPKTPFVYKKFEALLTGAGVVPKRNGDQLQLVPITDKEVDEIAGKNEIQNFSMLNHKLQPVKGGLFDKEKTGGTNGQKWAKITLPEPMPNPAFASAIKVLLDLKDSEYKAILTGQKLVNGKAGGEAFKEMLKKINIDQEIEKLKKEYETAAKTKKDKIRKKLAILRGLKKQGLRPEEVFVISKIPVIPPIYRPIFELPNGVLTVSSPNYLYRDLGFVAQTLKEAKNLPNEAKVQLREELYHALGALQGVTGFNPISKQALNKNAKGFLRTIAGDSPKTGFFQNKVMRKQQDLSGRATAAVENNLSMDEVMIPTKMAQKLYGPFAQKKLIQMGYSPAEAKEQIEQLTEVGKKALEDAMAERPILLNRAPSLHRFSIMAFRPKMYNGLTLKVPGLITSPYNLDFDGDCVNPTKEITYKIDGEIKVVKIKDTPKTSIKKKSGNKVIYNVPKNLEVLSYDEKSKSIKWVPVQSYSEHFNLNMLKVKTALNREVIASDDHSLYCIDENLNLIRTKTKDSLGKLTPRPKSILTKTIKQVYLTQYQTERRGKSLPLSVELNADIGYLIGAMVSDGWGANAHYSECGLAKSDENILDFIQKTVKKIIPNIQFTVREQRNKDFYDGKYISKKLQWFSREFQNLLHDWIGTAWHNKHLPPFFLEMPLECKQALLCGLLEGDGTITVSHSKKNPQYLFAYHTGSEQLAYQVSLLLTSMGIRNTVQTYKKKSKDNIYYMVTMSSLDIYDLKPLKYLKTEHKKKLYEQFLKDFVDFPSQRNRFDIVPVSKEIIEKIYELLPTPKHKDEYYHPISKARKRLYIGKKTAQELFEKYKKEILELPTGKKWQEIIYTDTIFWDVIKSIEPVEETMGCDLTVPGSATFVTADQLIVYDTMQVHVPFSEEARQEAFNMLPSKNLWAIRTRDLNYMPAQEAVTGLYLLTKDGKKTNKKYNSYSDMVSDLKAGKINITDVIYLKNKRTTPGRELINKILPDEYDLTGPVDKGRMKEILKLVADKYPDKYKDIVEELKKIGDEYATSVGFSISLNDLKVKGAEKIREEYKKAIGNFKKLQQVDQKAQEMAKKIGDENNFAVMVRSGGRGKPMNLKQIMIAPGLMMDMKGNVLPNPVTSSYGEGMDFTDYFSSLYGVRKGMMDIATMTAKPGAFAKEVLSTTADLVVTMHDCGTHEGIEMDKDDPDIIGRVLARDYGQFKRNSVITSFVASKLPQKVLVRSPLTCEAPYGVCQLCFGHDESGHFPPLGTNVGTKSAQAMTEPLTQAALSTKHTGGVASAGNTIGGFYAIQQYMQIPKKFHNEAVIVEKDGKVEQIKERPGGGWDITVAGQTYFVPPKTKLLVKKGQFIKKGDKLNTGIPHPEKVLKTQGFTGIVNEMKNIYEATGIKVDKKNIETVFRGITGFVEVEDPGDSDYLPGDIIPLSTAQKAGIKKYRRVPVGTNKAHSVSDNWMARLGFRNLTKGLTEGALYGYATNIHGYHPVPAYATGEIRINSIEY